MEMHNEISNRRVVDGCARHRIPRFESLGIAGKYADDMKFGWIGEFDRTAGP